MNEAIDKLKRLFDFMDDMDELSIRQTNEKCPFRLSPEAEEIKRIVQSKGNEDND